MQNIGSYYIKKAYAESLIIIYLSGGAGKSAKYSAVIFTKEETKDFIDFCARLEKTSPQYQKRTSKTKHFRIDQFNTRLFVETEKKGEILATWKKAELENLRLEFMDIHNCVMTQKDATETGKTLYNFGHFGEFLIYKLFGMIWKINTLNYKKGADIECGDFTAEIKTVIKGAAQYQPCINQYL